VAVGVTQPSGAGTTIFYYDNASAANGLYYTFAEIAAAFPADFISNTTNFPSYRSKVSLQCGDTGTGTATTTLQDTNCAVFFDANRTMLWRTTQSTSWNLNLGAKVGSGNVATGRNSVIIHTPATVAGTTVRGNFSLYGCTWIAGAGSLNFATTGVAGLTTEMVDCIIGHTGTGNGNNIVIGGATVPAGNVYNVDFWGNVSAANNGILTNFNFTTGERLTLGGPSMPHFLRSGSLTITCKDIIFFGTPTVSDIIPLGSITGWDFVRPKWSGNAPVVGTAAIVSAGVIRELWVADTKVVDRNGDGVSGISVKVTDSIGTVQVNTTTTSTGRIAFGSGLLTNAVIVRDHYADGVSYLTRDRSPFLFEINVTNQNTSYPALRYYTGWPTDVNGNFEDMADPIPLQYASGNPTTWVEAAL
jgi:hypothetical protein